MKAIKRTIALIIALVLVLHSLYCTAATPDSLFIQYSKLLSPEKVYLHTDREVYNLGDTIWFKGYLQNASASQEYPERNYIYVDISSPKWETDYDNKIKSNIFLKTFQIMSHNTVSNSLKKRTSFSK